MNDHVCKRFIWSWKKKPSSSSTSIWLYLFFDSSGDYRPNNYAKTMVGFSPICTSSDALG